MMKDKKTFYKEQNMETLAIIIPCYNEQEALPLFYKEASKILEKLNYDYKLLLINDGSKDNTLSIMKSIAEKDEHVKYLSFSRNFGKEAAMYAGFCNANADYVCVMDADMQDPQIENAFRPFVTYKPGGTGLGLAVTRQIIEAHQGTLCVESTPKEGTSFYIFLPG